MQEKIAQMEKIRKLVEQTRAHQMAKNIDYTTLTAPCGLPCFSCPMYLARKDGPLTAALADFFALPQDQIGCSGCRENNGNCSHLPMACRVYPCTQNRQLHNCSQCEDFPCDLLHPYRDMAELFHNTKMFNLCLISRMGLEEWAAGKASSVLDTYSYGQWTL